MYIRQRASRDSHGQRLWRSRAPTRSSGGHPCLQWRVAGEGQVGGYGCGTVEVPVVGVHTRWRGGEARAAAPARRVPAASSKRGSDPDCSPLDCARFFCVCRHLGAHACCLPCPGRTSIFRDLPEDGSTCLRAVIWMMQLPQLPAYAYRMRSLHREQAETLR